MFFLKGYVNFGTTIFFQPVYFFNILEMIVSDFIFHRCKQKNLIIFVQLVPEP